MNETLIAAIREALGSLGLQAEFSVEHPSDASRGDYSTNAALAAAKTAKKNPKELAEHIAEALRAQHIASIERIETAGAGFINFYLSREYFAGQVQRALAEKESYGRNAVLSGKRVIVEYTDPNPFKELHIGHLMSNTIGESVARLFEAQGAVVSRACYQGDVGLHVAKAIYGMQSVPHRDGAPLETLSVEAKARYLGHAYALGAAAYEDGKKADIEELNKKIYDRSDADVNRLYEWGRRASLEYFEMQYKRLGTKFDHYFFESEAAPAGKKIVEEGLSKGVFEKSDGAVVFHAEKHDKALHTRVFVNSQGIPTYEAKELGLSGMKEQKWPHDLSMVITGNEVNDYFRVLLTAMKLLSPALAEKTVHLSHGMLRLPTGKMSSRKGDVVTADSLIDRVAEMVSEKISERDYADEQKKDIAEAVSVGAIKFSILRQHIGGDIIFDFDKSISFEGDSGPYLQYSAARARSLLSKAAVEGFSPDASAPTQAPLPFEKRIAEFPEVIARAGHEKAPHYIVTYLLELCAAFNGFYAQERVAVPENKHVGYHLALTEAFVTVLNNGLSILGIRVPERM